MSPEDKSRNIARMAVENFTLGAGRTAFINQAIEANFDLREQILADLAVKEAEEKIQVGVRATVSKFVA